MIKAFPNGLATKSVPRYEVITTQEAQSEGGYPGHPVYAETSQLAAAGSLLMMTPLRVVASMAVDDGIGGTAKTEYQYRDLRVSPNGRGSQGFGTTIVVAPEDLTQPIDHRTRVATTTQYLQAFPYTAQPFKVRRELVDASTLNKLALVSLTVTNYCDAVPGTGQSCTPVTGPGAAQPIGSLGSKRFVRATTVADTTFLLSSAMLASGEVADGSAVPLAVSTTFVHDAQGNPLETTVTTSATTTEGVETYEKRIVNAYGTPGSAEERLGKVTLSTVTTRRVTPQDCLSTPIVHVTKYEYGEVNRFESPTVEGVLVSTLGLKKTIVEPGAGAPIELHTVNEYDRFGNVTKTTSCASEFAACGQLGATGSNDLPYRITRVSYDPADFALPPNTGRFTSLPYGRGRYPVKTTNAAGHVELTVYDARFGKLLQQTGPNGISTCSQHDGLGRMMIGIGRCGSASELVTRTQFFSPLDAEFGQVKVVTATTPPTGSPSWAYADPLGRTIMTLSRSFNSGYVKALTLYDNMGRVSHATKPTLSTSPDLIFDASAHDTITHFDAIGRVSSVIEDLGVLDGIDSASSSRFSTNLTIYDGATITSKRTVNGETRTRSETKNALGKLASVIDANGVALSFTYDADGNPTDTAAPADVCNPPPGSAGKVIHNTYDTRGRKLTSHDPDLGDWTYQYNGFGETVVQTDGKNRPTIMTYDSLGRLVQRDDDSGTARWVYDVAPHGIGKLAAMVSPSDSRLEGDCQVEFAPPAAPGENRAGRSYHYTAFGEVADVAECADGSSFVTSYGYDQFARTNLTRYPVAKGQRFAVKYAYTSAGYLRYVADDADGGVLWAAKAMNAAGQVTDEILRNGVETASTRNEATGWLLARTSTAHADGETVIQDFAYAFDEIGNLRRRQRTDAVNAANALETFGYDPLDRLTTSRVEIPTLTYDATEAYAFDPLGNLQTKAGKTYKYGTGCTAGARPAGPHALCQIDNGPTYSYDSNGNLASVGARTIGWNAANKATHLSNGTQTVDFIYGADGQRVVQSVGSPGAGTQARTVYVGLGATGKSLYERTQRGNLIEHAHFIYAGGAHGGSAFAIRTVSEDSSSTATRSDYRYHHFDHLGSVTAESDSWGRVTTPASAGSAASLFGYDPWGARRSPEGRAADPSTFAPPTGNRAFTGQEAIPDLGLINMNGRIYDPIVGRFLSADPNVQFASDLQSYNRYSYASGNPLRYTDPTGYFTAEEGFMTGLGILIGVVNVAACSTGAGCVAVVAINAAFVTTTSVVMFNQPAASAIAFGVVGFATGSAFGALGAQAGAALVGNGALGAVVGGTISGAASAAFMTLVTGGDLGVNMLTGAAYGALGAALAVGVQQANPVSQAEADVQKGAYAPQTGAETKSGKSPRPSFVENGRITDAGRTVLQRTFDRYNFDVRQIKVIFKHKLGQAGITVGNRVYLDDSFQYHRPYDQISLLAHEITHSVQYRDLGKANFLERYAVGYGRPDNYDVPIELWAVRTDKLSVTQTGSYLGQGGFRHDFTLDQIAERIAIETASAVPR